MSLKPTDIYEFTVPASGSYRLMVQGDYFKILAASGAVDVLGNWGRLSGLTAGQGLEESPFQSLLFTDKTGGPNVLRVVIGDQKFIDGVSGSAAISSNVVARVGGMTHTSVTVTNASAQHVAANAARQYIAVQNRDVSGILYLRFGAAATTATGILIPPGQSYESGAVVSTQAVHIIGSIASNANVLIVEG